MPTYASQTEVAPDRSRAEIERTLVRYGATKFMYGWEDDMAAVAFEMKGRRLRFTLPLPDRAEFSRTPQGKPRAATAVTTAYDQAVRQRWRALSLAIKAKLESVEAGIEQFEEAFMAQIVLPGGKSVGEWMVPQIHHAYLNNTMPPLLGLGSGN